MEEELLPPPPKKVVSQNGESDLLPPPPKKKLNEPTSGSEEASKTVSSPQSELSQGSGARVELPKITLGQETMQQGVAKSDMGMPSREEQLVKADVTTNQNTFKKIEKELPSKLEAQKNAQKELIRQQKAAEYVKRFLDNKGNVGQEGEPIIEEEEKPIDIYEKIKFDIDELQPNTVSENVYPELRQKQILENSKIARTKTKDFQDFEPIVKDLKTNKQARQRLEEIGGNINNITNFLQTTDKEVKDNIKKAQDLNRGKMAEMGFVDSFENGFNQTSKALEISNALYSGDDSKALQLLKEGYIDNQLYGAQERNVVGEMLGGQAQPLGTTFFASLISGGNPIIGTMAGTVTYAKLGAGAEMQQAFNEAMAQGMGEQEAYNLAKQQSEAGFLGGAAEGILGTTSQALGLASKLKITPKFAKAITETLADAGIDGTAAMGAQYYQNLKAAEKGLERKATEGLGEQFASEAIFSIGFQALFGLGSKITPTNYKTLVNNIAKVPTVISQQAVDQAVKSGMINEAKAGQIMEDVQKSAKAQEKLQGVEIPEKSVDEVIDLQKQLDVLEEQKKTASPAALPAIEGKIEQLSSEIQIQAAIPLTAKEKAELNKLQTARDENKAYDKDRLKVLEKRQEAAKKAADEKKEAAKKAKEEEAIKRQQEEKAAKEQVVEPTTETVSETVVEQTVVEQPTEVATETVVESQPTPQAGSVVGGEVEIKNEGKADAPTKESVTKRLNIDNPFYKKVEDALVKLGLIEKYNPETGKGDVVGGYAQETSDGGFSAGKMLFSKDGSISYFDGDVKVSFDKNGNVISENTKEVKQKAAKLEIEGKKESIAKLEKTRDSEAFKYKEVTETDVLGNKKKVKRLKTPQELKESTDKINAAIDKAKAELAALEALQTGSVGVGGDENAWGSDKGLTENFYTTDVDGYAIKKPITNPSSVTIDGVDFHIAKVDGDWKVIEKKSGLEISTGKISNTKNAAIEDATIRLAQNGGAKNLPTLIDRAIQGFKDRNTKAVEQSLKETPTETEVVGVGGDNPALKEIGVEIKKDGTSEGFYQVYKDGKFVGLLGATSFEQARNKGQHFDEGLMSDILTRMGIEHSKAERNIQGENEFLTIRIKNSKAVEQSIKETPTQTGSVGVEGENPALKDVEATAKALEDSDFKTNTPIKGLSVRMSDLRIAEDNLSKGKKSITPNEPIDVTINLTTGNRELSDGYHRYLDARGGTIEKAKTRNLEGSLPAKIKFEINEKGSGFVKTREATNKEISEAYHKAKADGSNPELVEAVENLLGSEKKDVQQTRTESKIEQEPNIFDQYDQTKGVAKKDKVLTEYAKANPEKAQRVREIIDNFEDIKTMLQNKIDNGQITNLKIEC